MEAPSMEVTRIVNLLEVGDLGAIQIDYIPFDVFSIRFDSPMCC